MAAFFFKLALLASLCGVGLNVLCTPVMASHVAAEEHETHEDDADHASHESGPCRRHCHAMHTVAWIPDRGLPLTPIPISPSDQPGYLVPYPKGARTELLRPPTHPSLV